MTHLRITDEQLETVCKAYWQYGCGLTWDDAPDDIKTTIRTALSTALATLPFDTLDAPERREYESLKVTAAVLGETFGMLVPKTNEGARYVKMFDEIVGEFCVIDPVPERLNDNDEIPDAELERLTIQACKRAVMDGNLATEGTSIQLDQFYVLMDSLALAEVPKEPTVTNYNANTFTVEASGPYARDAVYEALLVLAGEKRPLIESLRRHKEEYAALNSYAADQHKKVASVQKYVHEALNTSQRSREISQVLEHIYKLITELS